jgi:hypothetical protein
MISASRIRETPRASRVGKAAKSTGMINPRHLREKFKDWVGKRVTVGTTNYHYLSGTWKSLDAATAVFEIGGKEMKVSTEEIATIVEAPPWQADFFK